RPVPVLAPHPRLEVTDEVPLVDEVLRLLERAHALADLENRRDRGDRYQRARRAIAVLAGELQREVAAERVAGDRDRRQAVDLGELLDDVTRVGGQARVKQPS